MEYIWWIYRCRVNNFVFWLKYECNDIAFEENYFEQSLVRYLV